MDARASSITRCGDYSSKYGTASSPRASFPLQQCPERASDRRVYRVQERRSLDSRPTTSQKRRAVAGRNPGGVAAAVMRSGRRSPYAGATQRPRPLTVASLTRQGYSLCRRARGTQESWVASLFANTCTQTPHSQHEPKSHARQSKARQRERHHCQHNSRQKTRVGRPQTRQGTQMGESMRNKHK